MHECDSDHIASVCVTERSNGKIIWDGTVEVFGLIGHPQAMFCYAWAYRNGRGKNEYAAVLGLPPVKTAHYAVRAALAAQGKNQRESTKRPSENSTKLKAKSR
jgi:hypothetical protein